MGVMSRTIRCGGTWYRMQQRALWAFDVSGSSRSPRQEAQMGVRWPLRRTAVCARFHPREHTT